MQDFVDAAKRAASQAAERAAWEANRLRRISARQRETDLAQRERATLLEQMARVVLDLERQGQLTQEPLLALCRRLRTLDSEITAGTSEVQTMRAESFKPGSSPAYGGPPARSAASGSKEYPCPTCGKPVRDTAAYCSVCGTRLH